MNNAPEQSGGRGSDVSFFLGACRTALLRPTVAAYAQLPSDPRATVRTAYFWMWAWAMAAGVLAAQVRHLSNAGFFWSGNGIWLGLLELAIFVVTTGILFGLARLFHGRGSYGQFAYICAAFTAPLFLLVTVLGLLLPTGNATMLLWLLPFSIYATVLSVIAVKAVHDLDWTRAILTVVLPGLVVNCADIIIFGGFLSAVGPTIVVTWPTP